MADMVTDPVCGMEIERDDAEATSSYRGKTYYFCAQDCKAQFDDEPERFVREDEGRA